MFVVDFIYSILFPKESNVANCCQVFPYYYYYLCVINQCDLLTKGDGSTQDGQGTMGGKNHQLVQGT